MLDVLTRKPVLHARIEYRQPTIHLEVQDGNQLAHVIVWHKQQLEEKEMEKKTFEPIILESGETTEALDSEGMSKIRGGLLAPGCESVWDVKSQCTYVGGCIDPSWQSISR